MALAHPYLIFFAVMTPIAGALLALLALFRRARLWSTPWRRVAQAPGWLLVALGAYVVVGLAWMELKEKRGGLGTGTLMAMIGAGVKALFRGSDSESST